MFLILALFLASISTSFISAVCEEGQIDVNSVPKEELMKIKGLIKGASKNTDK